VSPTYLYCLTAHAAPDPPPSTVGLDGGAVRRLGDAWVSDVDSRSVRATVDRIRAHDNVVAAALGTGSTPLPARFGQTFESDDDCLAVLSAKKTKMSAGLARVAGMVEMTVILRVDLDASSGTAYLASLARREHAARDLNARLGDCVHESAERAKDGVVTLSHLVSREEVDTYRERLEGLDVRVIGPGAPYSFGPSE
jgi:Gas vesicle synthesis protein GvpL/GvpF